MAVPSRCFFYGPLLLFMFHECKSLLCHLICSLWPCGQLLGWAGLLCVVFSCVFVTFLCGVPGPVWCLVVSIPDLCHLGTLKDLDEAAEARRRSMHLFS